MSLEIKVPAVGESITEATVGSWLKKSGDFVKRNEVLLVLETDKASVEVVAESDGVLSILTPQGQTVAIGATVGKIDPSAAPMASAAPQSTAPTTKPTAPAVSVGGDSSMHLSPAVRRIVDEKGIDPKSVAGTGKDGRLTKKDVLDIQPKTIVIPEATKPSVAIEKKVQPAGSIDRVPMTTIRKKIAERLVHAQQTAAILTTFNEVDMSAVMDIRAKYKDQFEKKHNVKLGFMGFFVKACIQALKEFPAVNASIEGTDILYKNFYNIGVAVSTPKGLVVPVIRNADQLTLAEIEAAIGEFGVKARDGKITVDDMADGTFTISNGGVFGSLMSTPILNPPQSGILGMHKIEKRPIAIGDNVVVRPMMYLALSYDHRMIDGRESVSFLVRLKECIEDPSRILMEI
ncbi:2-oxoglutarate dehydrogenase complex dihydrolipoyllysine-residue succinyltransferase [bacterium]|nr:2-oxoglutarate dehydrogenase complex dihydrolipoyllysine-residue succinyltransferase [bacterium]